MQASIDTLMAKARSGDELSAYFRRYFLSEGIERLALTYYQYHIKTGSSLRYHWVSEALRPWHEHYLGEGYADVDRTLEDLAQSSLPIFWCLEEQIASAKNAREKRLRLEAKSFGLDKGLCLPLRGFKGDFLVLVLHQGQEQHSLANYQTRQWHWLGLLQGYYHYLRLLLNTDKTHCYLTQREHQCLSLTADGLRVSGIAKTLGIRERTVNFHLQNANKKLGTNSKYHAIFKLHSS